MSVIAAATAIHWLTYDCSVALLYSTEQSSRHSDADNKRGDTGNRWIDGWVVLLTICVPTKVVWRVGRANSSNKSLPHKKCSNANQWQPVTGIFKQFPSNSSVSVVVVVSVITATRSRRNTKIVMMQSMMAAGWSGPLLSFARRRPKW